MANSSQSLFQAILEDDRAGVKALLKQDRHLVGEAVATEAGYDVGIAHWIYVGDAALHLAAAGYRVEVAELLLAAGANPKAAGRR